MVFFAREGALKLTVALVRGDVGGGGGGGGDERSLDDLQRRARVTWAAAGRDDGAVDQILGLRAGTVEQWRVQAVPDGVSWGEFADRLGLMDGDDLVRLVGPQNEYEMSLQMLRLAQKTAAACASVLNEGRLYDKRGNLVEELYDARGKAVPVGGMRPKDFGEATRGLRAMSEVMSQNFAAVRELSDIDQQWHREREEYGRQVQAVVLRAFGEEGLSLFMEVAKERRLDGLGSDGGGIMVGADVVGVAGADVGGSGEE